jgi:cell division protein FtsW
LKWLYWLLPVLFLGGLGTAAALQMPHVKHRIQVYLHPESDLLGKGHQPYQAKIATGSGELFGRGVGESLQKLNYLPEARSDYIAAIYAEELGFIGILFLVLLYLFIAYSGFHIAMKAGTKEGFYVASVITFLISFQAFINLGVVSGLLPSKGTNLPFFSQGGSSLLANCIAIALIMSTHKKKEPNWKKLQVV